jgi:hypothetical protein
MQEERLLFEKDYLEAFADGAAVWLVRQRNQHLGSLLNSEHRDFYIQILHRMLYFRREHELEPLNEDIYIAVKPALEKTSSEEYTPLLFNRHINQLNEWELIVRRLEKERLHGYRDDRRDRFRYRLSDETVSFLYWLEDRLRGGDEDTGEDAGDLLDFVLSRLRELGRDLGRVEHGGLNEEDAVRKASNIVFLLHNINEYTEQISRRLGEMSANMESFLLRSYNIMEAQEVINELRAYLGGYLNRINTLRQQILSELENFYEPVRAAHLANCFQIHARESLKAPRFMRRSGMIEAPDKIIERLSAYYRQQGQIDSLCGRVNGSAMKVWGKLSAHLRELERKNNRCEEIDKRIKEIKVLPENTVPVNFFRELVSSAAMLGDPNHWDEFTKAVPPQPRFASGKIKKTSRAYLPQKRPGATPAMSFEEARLKQLQQWIESKFTGEKLKTGVPLDSAQFSGIEDFRNIMNVGKKGILGQGKALRKINFELDIGKEFTEVRDERRSLGFRDTLIREVIKNEQ